MMNKAVILTVIIFLLTPLLAEAAAPSKMAGDYLVKTGEDALKAGDITGAIHEFSKALMLDPENHKARWYLNKMHVEGLYSTPRTQLEQIGQMAGDIGTYQEKVNGLEQERYYLQNRVDLLEDAIERKGDHQLLKDVEDYYRETAFFDVDPNLPYDQQVAAMRRKHDQYKEFVFARDREQDKTIIVMDQLLGYKEKHVEDAKDDFVRHRIALAKKGRELLNKTARLKRLQHELDIQLRQNLRDEKKIQELEQQVSDAKTEIEMLKRQHESELSRLKEQVQAAEGAEEL